jgi:predicted O-methyltransferase YrrM
MKENIQSIKRLSSLEQKHLLLSALHSYSVQFSLEHNVSSDAAPLIEALSASSTRDNVPSIHHDVGAFLTFLCEMKKPKNIFEFGSGCGQSAFWYFLANNPSLAKVYLSEKREVLEATYEALPWPSSWKDKIHFHFGDAFDLLPQIPDNHLDLVLLDGQKARYQKYYDNYQFIQKTKKFFELIKPKLKTDAWVIVDNAFWKGSVLEEPLEGVKEMSKPSVRGLKELMSYLQTHHEEWKQQFVPFADGVLVLRRC